MKHSAWKWDNQEAIITFQSWFDIWYRFFFLLKFAGRHIKLNPSNVKKNDTLICTYIKVIALKHVNIILHIIV